MMNTPIYNIRAREEIVWKAIKFVNGQVFEISRFTSRIYFFALLTRLLSTSLFRCVPLQ